MPEPDLLLDRILASCKLSQGTMPVAIIVADQAEAERGRALLKGRHNNARITFVTRAELAARRGRTAA